MAIKLEGIEIIEEQTICTFAKVNSFGLIGINAYPIEIEVAISGGIPNFILVGLPDTAVNESRERVRAAVKASNIEFPSKKIVINLAPADTKKAGPTYDLPIAIGILASLGLVKKDNLNGLYIIGELGLAGKVRQVNGTLSFIILAKNNNTKGVIIPSENHPEASLIHGINIYPVSNLNEAINTINNIDQIKPQRKEREKIIEKNKDNIDMSDVKGQVLAKRSLEIAASGNHHILLIGSPGAGKTILAKRLTTILSPLTYDEKIEITQIYSICGKLNKEIKLITNRPFRSPHHTISSAGLIGGGSEPKPGEISLAHKGVLFLDEFTEFQRQVLDSLRQALEEKEITISRSRKSCTFPCDFLLIAACNPCPCGYFGDEIKKCSCNLNTIKKYQSKLSGPILDRIDLQVEVKRLKESELSKYNQHETSNKIKEKVLQAKEIQSHRYKKLNISGNSGISFKEIKNYCMLSKNAELVLKEAIKNFALTARSYDRILKISRTIADLSGSDIIKDEHILESLQFRLNNFGTLK